MMPQASTRDAPKTTMYSAASVAAPKQLFLLVLIAGLCSTGACSLMRVRPPSRPPPPALGHGRSAWARPLCVRACCTAPPADWSRSPARRAVSLQFTPKLSHVAGLAQPRQTLPAGVYSIRLEQGSAACNRGELPPVDHVVSALLTPLPLPAAMQVLPPPLSVLHQA